MTTTSHPISSIPSIPSILAVLLCACGANPTVTPTSSPAVPTSEPAAASRPELPPAKTALRLIYELTFSDSTGTVELWLDGDFLIIEQTWKRSEGVPRLRFGATQVRMVYDSAHRILFVVNLENHMFTRLTAERVQAENALLATQPHMGLGMSDGSSPSPGDTGQPAEPMPVDPPSQTHPPGCSAFARPLPMGLQEETCFQSWDRFGLSAPDDFSTLSSFVELVGEINGAPWELRVAIDIAEALLGQHGVLVSRREFGVSPFGEGDTIGLESWDIIVALTSVERLAPKADDFTVPKKAEEVFSLFPWKGVGLR